jgi:hypothetical protein
LPRATVNKYVPSFTAFGKRTTISVSLERNTIIFSVSQKTVGVFLPKWRPRSVAVSSSTLTNAESTTTCFQRSKSSNRL